MESERPRIDKQLHFRNIIKEWVKSLIQDHLKRVIARLDVDKQQMTLNGLHGLMLLWIALQRHIQELMIAVEQRKRNRFLQKAKNARMRRLRRKHRYVWFNPGRTEEWWIKMVNGEGSDDAWHKNVCLSRNQFNCVVRELAPSISPDPKSPNYSALSAEKKVAVTLYYLEDTGSLCMTANSFALSTTSSVISEVCSAICNVLGNLQCD
eukprot:gene14875-6007_t